MPDSISPELYWLILTTLFTGVLWMPYMLEIIGRAGMFGALAATGGTEPKAEWSIRAKKAHANAVENLVVFAPLAIAVHVLDAGSALTANAAAAYFALRVAHAVVFTFGIPYLRTLTFMGAFGCQLVLVAALLT